MTSDDLLSMESSSCTAEWDQMRSRQNDVTIVHFFGDEKKTKIDMIELLVKCEK